MPAWSMLRRASADARGKPFGYARDRPFGSARDKPFGYASSINV